MGQVRGVLAGKPDKEPWGLRRLEPEIGRPIEQWGPKQWEKAARRLSIGLLLPEPGEEPQELRRFEAKVGKPIEQWGRKEWERVARARAFDPREWHLNSVDVVEEPVGEDSTVVTSIS